MIFAGTELRYELERRRGLAMKTVEQADDGYLLNVSENEWVDHLLDEYGMDVPELDMANATSQIAGSTRTQSGVIARAEVIIPFEGRGDLFGFQPNLWGPRQVEGEEKGGMLVKHVKFPPASPPDLTPETWLGTMRSFLNAASNEAQAHNQSLSEQLHALIGRERTRILEARQALEELSLPIVDRPDAPRTYSVPGVERREAPPLPATGSQPVPLEPRVFDEFFEHSMAVIGSAGRAMERTPGTFADGSETQKRDVLLVMLNGHYQGAAAGEVFNGAGKADIMLRFADHNVLVAECKFWDGISSFREALEQLEGYLTLRDTHAALIVFVRGKDVHGPVAEAEAFVAGLDGAEQLKGADGGTEFRFRLKSTRFEDRTVTLHVQFFHVRRDG
ncbi:MAG TPA: hypothetical protein VFG23_23020 [Polyangia bacterium]|nr:hypothetical protein [Polyangia bacterium]